MSDKHQAGRAFVPYFIMPDGNRFIVRQTPDPERFLLYWNIHGGKQLTTFCNPTPVAEVFQLMNSHYLCGYRGGEQMLPGGCKVIFRDLPPGVAPG